jgi:hypothetical protein
MMYETLLPGCTVAGPLMLVAMSIPLLLICTVIVAGLVAVAGVGLVPVVAVIAYHVRNRVETYAGRISGRKSHCARSLIYREGSP